MTEIQILVVEDESIVAEDIRRSLQKFGYAVPAVVVSGEEAVKKVEEIIPDLVLMDIMLAGEMDGIEAADRIRSSFSIPVVYLTAYSDGKILERAKLTSPFGYIIKPFKERELKINVEIALHNHKMEKKLKESKEWFSTTLRSIGDAVIATDSNSCVIFMNPVAQLLTGWKLENASGRSLNEVFNIVNEGEAVENPVTKAASEGVVVVQANQTVLIAKNRTKIPIDENIDPIKDDNGNIIGSVIVFHDITERRQAEEEIRRLKEFYENVLESIVTGVWVTDKNDGICYANKGMEEITGMAASKIAGVNILKNFQEVFKPYYLKARGTLKPFYYEAVPFVTFKGPSYQSGWLIPRVKNGNFNGMICTVESIPKHEHLE